VVEDEPDDDVLVEDEPDDDVLFEAEEFVLDELKLFDVVPYPYV